MLQPESTQYCVEWEGCGSHVGNIGLEVEALLAVLDAPEGDPLPPSIVNEAARKIADYIQLTENAVSKPPCHLDCPRAQLVKRMTQS